MKLAFFGESPLWNKVLNNELLEYFPKLSHIETIVTCDNYQLLENYDKNRNSTQSAGQESNRAMKTNTGGIDLTPAHMNLLTKNAGEGIQFHLDPAMLQQLQNASGFVPVVISIQPLKSLPEFLGLNDLKAEKAG